MLRRMLRPTDLRTTHQPHGGTPKSEAAVDGTRRTSHLAPHPFVSGGTPEQGGGGEVRGVYNTGGFNIHYYKQ